MKGNILTLLGMVVLVGLGEKMAERFLPLYLLALGGGSLAVGLLNGLDNLLSALYSFPGGYVTDRWGYRRALVLFNLVAMTGFLIVILFPSWKAVLVGAVFFVSWTAISLPAIMDMVARVLPENRRTMGVSLHSLVRRIPMALGPVIGGVMIGLFGERDGIRIAFVVAFVLAGASILLQQIFIRDDRPVHKESRSEGRGGLRLIGPPLRTLLTADILIRFCEQIPYAFVVIWCVTVNKITPLEFGLLTTVEMVTSMLVYIPVAHYADRGEKKPYVIVTFLFFTLFPLVLLFARSFWMMVIAFIIRGLKEFGEPTRKALIMDLAPEGRKAMTFGIYYLIRDVIVAVAAFSGALLWDPEVSASIAGALPVTGVILAPLGAIASPATNLLVSFVFGFLGTVWFLLFGRQHDTGTVDSR